MKYTVEILETLRREVEIEAIDASEALDKAKTMYGKEEIVLEADDHIGTDFNIFSDV